MRLPDTQKILDLLGSPTLPSVTGERLEGRLLTVGATLLRAHLPGVGLGEQCTLPDGGPAEVVAIEGDQALLSPYQPPLGLANGMLVTPSGAQARIGVGEALLGRVIDALGQPADGKRSGDRWRAPRQIPCSGPLSIPCCRWAFAPSMPRSASASASAWASSLRPAAARAPCSACWPPIARPRSSSWR